MSGNASSTRQLEATFGPLEIRVLEALWARETPACVRDLQPQFPGVAYTTLMTTLDRLFRKGTLSRAKSGRAFFYRPKASQQELISAAGRIDVRDAAAGRCGVGAADPLDVRRHGRRSRSRAARRARRAGASAARRIERPDREMNRPALIVLVALSAYCLLDVAVSALVAIVWRTRAVAPAQSAADGASAAAVVAAAGAEHRGRWRSTLVRRHAGLRDLRAAEHRRRDRARSLAVPVDPCA